MATKNTISDNGALQHVHFMNRHAFYKLEYAMTIKNKDFLTDNLDIVFLPQQRSFQEQVQCQHT